MASNRFSIPILSESKGRWNIEVSDHFFYEKSKPAEGYSKIHVMMQKKIINLQDQGNKLGSG
ncbi:hypothetical protein DU68_05740 [Methanosarcina mazei]|uniref:Uncharacterized protein n=1 Tax=Methanosarcina mazei TaxID=2209 RepID=A0A0F8LL98_METMZ|nr:hypothetical protein DU49_08615 [Methanosarcina mazei]KKG35921.1 hypothetical protein DU52_10100 [Methanosarcina mazei]KKG36968.1 hypothetical protein DU35_08510 [Methanosarcina mazei]KKG41916.1 hypothetical protein DU41_06765 [Methanosarcina mazei]KKG42257.1 hypothetical protein DU39_16295 [Methanosarcina mazei]